MKITLIFCAILLILSASCNAFDHSYNKYDEVLKRYVNGGLVDYAGLLSNRKNIDDVVSQIKSVTSTEYKKWNRNQQLAFWINTYNAWFLQIVINHYPIKKTSMLGFIYPDNSVQQIPGIWEELKLDTVQRKVSLDDIEHKILRPEFKEARIHFAIVCASLGCPQLKNHAYTEVTLEQELEDSAGRFINNHSKVRLMRAQKELQVSKIFKWFAEDFSSFARRDWKHWYAGPEGGVIGFISKYVPSDDLEFLQSNAVSIDYLDYDWTLNERK